MTNNQDTRGPLRPPISKPVEPLQGPTKCGNRGGCADCNDFRAGKK